METKKIRLTAFRADTNSLDIHEESGWNKIGINSAMFYISYIPVSITFANVSTN